MADDPYLARIAAKDVKTGMTLQVRELLGRNKTYFHHNLYRVTGAVEKCGQAYLVTVSSALNATVTKLRVSVRREKADRIMLFNRTWAPLPEDNLREIQDYELCGLPEYEPVWCDYCERWAVTTTQEWFTVERDHIYRPTPPDVLLNHCSGRGVFICPDINIHRSRRFYVRKAVAPQRSRVVSLLEVES